jgi:hypothetical protein
MSLIGASARKDERLGLEIFGEELPKINIISDIYQNMRVL